MATVTVGSRELKNHLGKYLQMVREGQFVEITDKGKPVGTIVPASAEDRETRRLIEVVSKGSVRLGVGKFRPTRKRVKMTPGKSIVEMISEHRG